MKIRTINQAVKELKKEDPDCNIGYSTLRNLIMQGALPKVRSGTKYLIDLDKIKEVFDGTNQKGAE